MGGWVDGGVYVCKYVGKEVSMHVCMYVLCMYVYT
jgi:hypothetical protein